MKKIILFLGFVTCALLLYDIGTEKGVEEFRNECVQPALISQKMSTTSDTTFQVK
ncbi:hypothetical protein PEDI_41990 [Persicobacter diffluens]|uniref:Uncharacterized protein n=1 Tax=Persicobacter diffluens TaxID=981 RepID=A0AAN4W3K5_9BACT|nr:hypothetical protein PEDI_41990 [Persicobacter diffluens]